MPGERSVKDVSRGKKITKKESVTKTYPLRSRSKIPRPIQSNDQVVNQIRIDRRNRCMTDSTTSRMDEQQSQKPNIVSIPSVSEKPFCPEIILPKRKINNNVPNEDNEVSRRCYNNQEDASTPDVNNQPMGNIQTSVDYSNNYQLPVWRNEYVVAAQAWGNFPISSHLTLTPLFGGPPVQVPQNYIWVLCPTYSFCSFS